MGGFAPKIVSGKLPENHGVAINLLNCAIEDLIVLPQEISVMDTIHHHRRHFACAVVFYRSLDQ